MPNDSLTLATSAASTADSPAHTRARSLAPLLRRTATLPLVRTLLREPLVHFAVLGAVIFGADAWLHPPVKDDHTITVTRAMRQSFIDNFDEDKERVPSHAQLQKMIDSWVASEILYREGKALAVDRGDDMIRDRIAYKLQLLIFDQIKVAQPTAAELSAWFASNHERFDEPERVGFYLTPPSDEATARRELEDIRGQRESTELQTRTRAVLARPVASVAKSFGESFRDALLALPIGEWSVLQSNEGWHVVRLDSHRAGVPAKLEDVRDDAARIWHTDETRKRALDAVNRLRGSYTVKYDR